ncbi:hypothetical protein C9994_06205 [Marivirga lumbricoides]|uniref:UDP-N-acetylglucosamine kinase n=1 Tax=Marivirga lumbricoides TaxID=1046115 RepID=A0A2T4DS68_9BACT|nr:hypothetical protein C9994_06205 [Marivirga lumbricoides]
MFAGPNGSGKSTVFSEIKSEYNLDLGVYLNADEIEKKLKKNEHINPIDYNLPKDIGKKFSDFVNSHTLYKKATKDGFKINLTRCAN